MKILFLQKDVFARLAIMLISAILKKAGHQCNVLVDDLEKDLVQKALKINPDIIAFSITSGEYGWMNHIGNQLRKKFKKPIICGGTHPTFYPEIIKEEYLDVICVGEGEGAILDLVNALANGEDITKTKNLIVKKDGTIYKNDIRPLIEDLDSNPLPDRNIYDIYGFYRDSKNEFTGKDIVQTSRGCPYSCSYCFNKPYMKLYKGKGKILRRKSVSYVIREIKEMRKKNPKLDFINFSDDVFTLPPKTWLDEFFEKYKKEINIPFMIITRADLLDEDIIKKLKEANCFSVKLGIESADDHIRNKIFDKKISTKQIVKAAYLLHKYNIKLQTYNLFGAPGETIELALKTYRLNKKLNATYAAAALLLPYPQTDIYNYAVKKGYLDADFDFDELDYSHYTSTPLKLKNIKEINNLKNLLAFSVSLHLPTTFVKLLIRLPFTPLYELIFGINYLIGLIRIHKVRLPNALKVAFFQFARYILKK